MSTSLTDVEGKYRKEALPDFEVGDRVAVAVLIREMAAAAKGKGLVEKTRTQNFVGDVIAISGSGLGRSFTVRRVVQGEGVERVFPVNTPRIAKFEVVRKADARRAKLYFLRDRVGKKRRLRDRRRGWKNIAESERGQK